MPASSGDTSGPPASGSAPTVELAPVLDEADRLVEIASDLDDVERVIACLDRDGADAPCDVCVAAHLDATLPTRPVLARCAARFEDPDAS